MKKDKQYRQGDVFLLQIKAPGQAALEPAAADPRGLFLAEGETSGHYHAVFGTGAKLFNYKQGGGRVVQVADAGAEMRVIGGGTAKHPRHEPIPVPAGYYKIRIQRAYESGMSSPVGD